jgi:Tol biopolymer transport system component
VGRLIVVFALGLLLAGCGGSSSSGTKENGPIAYIVAPAIGQGISTREPDGHRARLTHSGRDIYPTWSPDGTKIAFERGFGKEGGSHLFVMNADGSDVHQVSVVETASGGPSWTPDGSELVFDTALGISSIGADGSAPRHLGAKGFSPTVSPDGKTIVFERTPGLVAMNADGSGEHKLVEPPRGSTSGKNATLFTLREPEWAPDGKHLLFVKMDILAVTKPDGGATIEVVDADGGNERTVTKVRSLLPEVVAPSWSPDGESIVFAGRRGETDGLWTVPADGGTPKLLLESYKYAQPSWGPAAN